MTEKHLHIVTHDVPWPADFGGVVDLFYKIKTLHQYGIKIHLHCFTDKRPAQQELERYCTTIAYYPRNKSITAVSLRLPFIVNSRKSAALIAALQQDNYPVLLEGIHCTYPLFTGALQNRKVLVRLHNAEFEYYHHLAANETNLLKKFYYDQESRLLKKYEAVIAEKAVIAAVSNHDVLLYQQLFKAPHISFVPVFLPYTAVETTVDKGCYCLYQGNLSINENEIAAIWLLQNVFNQINIPFVIAGKNPSQKLEHLAHQQKNTCLVANPNDKELQDLIRKAQINILPSFNNTGVKLKLLNALYNGKFCIVNKAGAAGSGVEAACHIAESPQQFQRKVTQLYNQPFNVEEIEKREKLLMQYDNYSNAEKLIALLW